LGGTRLIKVCSAFIYKPIHKSSLHPPNGAAKYTKISGTSTL